MMRKRPGNVPGHEPAGIGQAIPIRRRRPAQKTMLNDKSTDPQHREVLVSMTALYFVEENALLSQEQLGDAQKSLQALFLRTSGEETMLRKLIEILKTTKLIHQSFASISSVLSGITRGVQTVDGKVAGLFAIADRVKATTPAALKDLKSDGVRIVMLTGDNRTTALAVAGRLGITDVEAEVLPGHKSDVVARLRAQGRVVAMAGDGVNDAPALAAADIGIAMGPGTDVAMESAGVTLLNGDLSGIMRARILSAATMRNIRQNLFFAFVYNAVGIPVAAGVLYPVFGILLSPVFAAAAMALSSVSVITNALRLQLVQLD